MADKIFYPTGDDFKWKERREMAKKFGVELVREERVDLGRRIEMLNTIEEAVSLKWKLASKKFKGKWVMVDMNDVLLVDRNSWYNDRRSLNITQKEFAQSLWLPVSGKTADLTKIGLKNVLMIGRGGDVPIMIQAILDGVIMFRPPQKSFQNLPAIVPLVYVSLWQEMLDQIYLTKSEERLSSRVTHDGRNLIQALSRISVR